MRQFHDFKEAQNEIKRDLAELSVQVPAMYQSKPVSDDPNFISLELYNYGFTVTNPRMQDLEGVHTEWLEVEWAERLHGDFNPGTSWTHRKDLWEPLLEEDGRFSYTYSERLGMRIHWAAAELKQHPYSRQVWLPIYWPVDDMRRGNRRVPCSLGYQLLFRNGKLHITYVMRSCDFVNHWPNDVALASLLMQHVAHEADMDPGTLSQFVGSLHVYKKDVEGVF